MGPRLVNNGNLVVEPRDGPAIGFSREDDGPAGELQGREIHIDLSVAPTGARRADIWKNRERAPVIVPLRNQEEIDEKQLRGRAARYYDNGQLYVNMLYPSIESMKNQLEQEYGDAPDIDQIRQLALQFAEQTIMLLVGRAVVYALAKQVNKDWNSEAVKQALAPESLSLAADDFHDALQSARRKIGTTFRMSGKQSERAVNLSA